MPTIYSSGQGILSIVTCVRSISGHPDQSDVVSPQHRVVLGMADGLLNRDDDGWVRAVLGTYSPLDCHAVGAVVGSVVFSQPDVFTGITRNENILEIK